MRPFKVSFLVSGGFVPPPMPLHLDALLAYQRTRQHLPRLVRRQEHSVETMRALGENLPLQRHEQDGQWCWMSSAVVPSGPVSVGSRFYTQRRDKAEYAIRVKDGAVQHGRHTAGEPMKTGAYQIDTLRGVYRNLLGYYPLLQKDADEGAEGPPQSPFIELVAWGVGDIDAIKEQLESGVITHLGQRGRRGGPAGERALEVARSPVETAGRRRADSGGVEGPLLGR